jgi:hypothetical protein
MIVPISWVFAGIGIVSMLVSIPMILRRVPMNRWYGVRTRNAFGSSCSGCCWWRWRGSGAMRCRARAIRSPRR